ncbi:hypothetical protein [Streptomyces sp. SAI-129]|uniref:hypothetical protein n=1 Tax=Streptomyces sp. SAI-129 TaxID=3377727 RepID=UPI003C7AB65B
MTGALGSRAAALVPALREALSGTDGDTTPALDTDTALAEALWRVTGEADGVVAVLDSVLARAEDPWSRWSVVRAARTTALLGSAGRPLAARLEAALKGPVQAPAAVLALTAVAEPASLDRNALAEAASVYWFTASATSSARLYWESLANFRDKVTAPSGLSVYPRDITRPSRREAELRFTDLRWFEELPHGGHFAALEQPDSLVKQVLGFFRLFR